MARILHIIDTTGPGGAETVFIELADRLRQAGHESIVMIQGEGWVCDELRRRQFDPLIVPAGGSMNIRFLWRYWRIVRQQRIDLIQSHLLGANVYSALVGLLARIPVVATYHGMVDVSRDERFQRLKLAVMRLGVSRYVAVSQRLADAIAARRLLDPAVTTVVHNGIDVGLYQGGRHQRLRRELGIDDQALLAGCVGNIRPAKAYDILIEALRQYSAGEDASELHVAIAGAPGALSDQLAEQARDAGVANHIHFIGFCDNTPDFLAGVDLFFLSSRSEGFSLSTVEALAAGLPVLCTRCGGPEEIVDGSCAILVAADDADAFARGIERCVDSKAEFTPAQQRQRAASFDLAAMISRYGGIYRELGVEN